MNIYKIWIEGRSRSIKNFTVQLIGSCTSVWHDTSCLTLSFIGPTFSIALPPPQIISIAKSQNHERSSNIVSIVQFARHLPLQFHLKQKMLQQFISSLGLWFLLWWTNYRLSRLRSFLPVHGITLHYSVTFQLAFWAHRILTNEMKYPPEIRIRS